jgi:hypothetical protein
VYLNKTSTSLSSSSSKTALPLWASWRWAKKYLPEDLHTKEDLLQAAILSFQKSKLVDGNTSTSLVLGLGLLLRECWRAVEVELEDDFAPDFLKESLLGFKRANDVLDVVRGLLVQEGEPTREVETEELVGDKEEVSKENDKKKGKKKENDNAPASPSESKKNKARKDDDSSARNTRTSSRKTKPSKKARGSDYA